MEENIDKKDSEKKRKLERYDDLYSDDEKKTTPSVEKRLRPSEENSEMRESKSTTLDNHRSERRDDYKDKESSSSSRNGRESSRDKESRDKDRSRRDYRERDRDYRDHRDRDRDRDGRHKGDHRDKDRYRDKDRKESRDSDKSRNSRSSSSYSRSNSKYDEKSERSRDDQKEKEKTEAEAKKEEVEESPEVIMARKKAEEEEFRKRVEAQMQTMNTEETEEDIIRKRRERRKAILERHQSEPNVTPKTSLPATPVSSEPATPTVGMSNLEIFQSTDEIRAVNTPPLPSESDKEERRRDVEMLDKLREEEMKKEKTEDFDMFGESNPQDEDENTFAPKPRSLESIVEESNYAEVTDDAEGYYCYRRGEILNKKYSIVGGLGKGVFSTVLKALDLTNNNHEVAIKILRNNEAMKRMGFKEIQILKDLATADPLNKYNCVRLLDNFEDRDHLCLVFEPMNGGNLREVLKKYGTKVGLNIKAVKIYAQKMILSLKLLKRVKILHADIKPDNILVNDMKTSIKLADFGSASAVTENQITPYLVSRFYRAPEIMLGLSYSYPIDMWSIGCSLFEIATGKILFAGKSNNEMLYMFQEVCGPFPKRILKKGEFVNQHFDESGFRRIMKDKLTDKEYTKVVNVAKPIRDIKEEMLNSSPYELDPDEKRLVLQLYDLVSQMLILDPEKRISVEDAMKHPFIASSIASTTAASVAQNTAVETK